MRRGPTDDTADEARRRQQAVYKRMTPAQKAGVVAQLNALSDAFALAGLRAGNPDADDEDLRMRLLVRKHGPELVEAAYGWSADD